MDDKLFNKVRNRIYGNYPEKGKLYAEGVAREIRQLFKWHEHEVNNQRIKPVPPSKNPGTKIGRWPKAKWWQPSEHLTSQRASPEQLHNQEQDSNTKETL